MTRWTGPAVAMAVACLTTTPATASVEQWTTASITQLVLEARNAAADGLDTDRYGTADRAIGPAAAETYALRLASDLSRGRVQDRAAHSWYMEAASPTDADLQHGLDQALDRGDLHGWLQSLRPADPSYAAIRRAFTATTDPVAKDRFRANMERWRWMPRDLPQGERIVVNVPTYRLAYVRPDGTVSAHDVVVGAARTPTPQLMAEASSVVVNPPWNVPSSIARGLRAGRKYRAIRTSGGGRRLQQAPGPGNALGRYKIEMPNAHAIYLHDTPAKGLFERNARAYSHGCIRVKGIAELAAELAGSADEPRDLSDALSTTRTRWFGLGRRVPVMIVYFTVEAQDDGGLVSYPDVYGRDRRLLDAMASR